MDYILIALILIILICMGYTLIKPFLYQTDSDEVATGEVNLEDQYQRLLENIRVLERDCESGTLPKEDCTTQLDEMKLEAESMLRVINLHMGAESTEAQVISAPDETKDGPPQKPSPQDSGYCPQCGEQIMESDKFCMHCGHTLQP